jgi:hypothetical protein
MQQTAFAVLRWLLVFWVLQCVRKMQKQMARLVSTRAAACKGSSFRKLDGVELHYTQHTCGGNASPITQDVAPDGVAPLLVHFNHGFGANALTWDPLFAQLDGFLSARSDRVASLAAHDRAGFRLTSRPTGERHA